MKKKGWILAAVGCMSLSLFCNGQSMATMSTYIPGAHSVTVQRFDDLTTNNAAIGKLSEGIRAFLYANDWSPDGKTAKKPAWYTSKEKIPGLQIEGMFADSRFVIRIPDQWNGKLVMGSVPGMRDERSTDDVFNDYVITRGFAYAATDKGTLGEQIPAPDGKIYPFAKALQSLSILKTGGKMDRLPSPINSCHTRPSFSNQGKRPSRTYLMGYSNGGYPVRYALERESELYDGGVDWSGIIWRGYDANLISSLVEALNSFRTYSDKEASAEQKAAALKRFGPWAYPKGRSSSGRSMPLSITLRRSISSHGL